MLSLVSALPAAAQPTNSRPPTKSSARPLDPSEARTAAYLESIRRDPARMREFFLRLPKGGDLHNHLSGAVRTEYLITLAAEDGLCIDVKTMTAVAPPCGPGKRPAADARTDRAFHDALVRAWSMQDFPPGQSGHDHFFDTFGKFGEVTWRHRGKLLAEVADGIVKQNQFYLETLITPASEEAKKVADEVGWKGDFDRMHQALVADGKLDRLVATARKETDDADAEFRSAARCGTAHPAPACRLTVRWNSQVSRGSSPERVFTQMEVGMRLAERDPRFAAVNLVQPEDWDSSLRNYSLQMRMLDYLHRTYPRAHITLHAGELWTGLVKPEDLKFHINEAVDVAHAERIGHGVDLVHEDNWQRLARTMAAREVAVEVPFTSNAQILGVKGAEHPFTTYRAYGVPIVLATDDPGISRIDITHEYQYAATTYGLRYGELKDLARASLHYSFLPGHSLWEGNPTRDGYRPVAACRGQLPGHGTPGAACRSLLAASQKAAVEWRQEAAFASFEGRFAGGRG
ncbi:adenosine deaminase family protein [Streptomyces sp. NRRL F-4489]|uniref:adenosine deaminase family protein n=1 Tax=Streptomyces sp. NRRL F-4489 TaxID=1609095 RepID=UPI000ACE6FAC|nr:adenosine deaminase [Streptomyces sp. NRRL F-4489]